MKNRTASRLIQAPGTADPYLDEDLAQGPWGDAPVITIWTNGCERLVLALDEPVEEEGSLSATLWEGNDAGAWQPVAHYASDDEVSEPDSGRGDHGADCFEDAVSRVASWLRKHLPDHHEAEGTVPGAGYLAEVLDSTGDESLAAQRWVERYLPLDERPGRERHESARVAEAVRSLTEALEDRVGPACDPTLRRWVAVNAPDLIPPATSWLEHHGFRPLHDIADLLAELVRPPSLMATAPGPATISAEQSPVQDLRGVEQATPDTSPAAYKAAFAAAGLNGLDDWAVDYLRKRSVAPEIAARRGYRSGIGNLPNPDDSQIGRWTNAQVNWATSGGPDGRRWLLIPWRDTIGECGWQLRWQEPREERIGDDVSLHKFDFPAARARGLSARLVDSMHVCDAEVLAIIESPVRADCLASIAPGVVSVVAVGGITMAYEGKSNGDNPRDWTPRLSHDVAHALGGVEGRHVLWLPDSDHDSNPDCNRATQQTVESLLDEGAAWVGVVDVPEVLTHPRSGRAVPLGKGAGLDDLAAAAREVIPDAQWLGPLLADAIDGDEYVDRYPGKPSDKVGLAEATAIMLARAGTFAAVASDKKGAVVVHHYACGHWGVDLAEAAATIVATDCANRMLGTDKSSTAKARQTARNHVREAVSGAFRTPLGKERLVVQEAQWEPREWAEYVPTPSGLLHPETLGLLPHRPEAMNLGVLTVDYKPGARSEAWEQFFREFNVFDNGRRDADGRVVWEYDEDNARMLQQIAGAALMARCFDTALFLVGAGGSGISTFVGALSGLFPPIYLGALSADELAGKGNQFVLSGVHLARLTEINEFKHSDRLSEALFKQITQDNSRVSVEPKYGDKFLSPVRSTLIGSTNHMPGCSPVAGQDNSLRRRVCMSEHLRVVTSPDSSLADRLATREAREAILAWAAAGAHAFLNSPERKPYRSARSQAAVEDWLANHDRLGHFIESCLMEQAGAYLERGAAFDAYVTWCERSHIPAMGRMDATKFFRAMEDRAGFGPSDALGNKKQVDGKWCRGWSNWRLRS